ncbi:hypothetical protein [Pseudomonas japonica]|uniref:Uncharacterized protein n=1 Tax=Pseudomonas japonica TaxID=256466 RepID=A0A239AZ94_9PSED|nr:hypothetical protein [Pseudomonas japonica]SNS01035.1 hypothetical protein SAMN05444352_102196 [Pseudomonas japonica]
MKSLLVLVLAFAGTPIALADSCPDVLNTASGSVDLRSFINTYGANALANAQLGLDQSRAQDCSSVLNSEECEATVELAALMVSTLQSCLSKVITESISKPSPPSNPPEKKSKSIDKVAADAANDPASNPWASEGNNSKAKSPNNEKVNIEAQGCPYVIQDIPGAFHSPKTYICYQGRTQKCDISGKKNGTVTYGWRVTNQSDCIHPEGWIDVVTVESNAAFARKQTKVHEDE